MSDEIDIKAKNLFRDREVHFIVTNYSIYQEDIILNLYTPKNVVRCKIIHVL